MGLAVVTAATGIVSALYVAILWACTKTESLLASLLAVVLAVAPIVYINLNAPWLPTPGRIARDAGWVTSTTQGLILGLGSVAMAAIGFFCLRRLGLVTWLAGRLSRTPEERD